ncbi:MAG: hypothetical protein F4Y81_08430, partial [Rhodothermaceae bacterium]|nr:hypothetical protein [Rhodothermaceae bacterium]
MPLLMCINDRESLPRFPFYLILGLIVFCYSPASPSWAQGSLEKDWKALVALYNATDGQNWTKKDNWSTDLTTPPTAQELDSWYGVTVTDGRVVQLKLSYNSLTGPIPSSLGNLLELEELDLEVNRLSGAIPSSLGDLSKLEELDLGHNYLLGTIPSSLGNLSKLKKLDLYNNRLSGTIPSS